MAVQVAGSINVDLIQMVESLPLPGETVMALRTTKLPGGKGANQAVAAARMGADTRFIGAVADDDDGRWMRDLLESDGIDTSAIATLPDTQTGLALIAVDSAGENQIIVSSGANALVTPDQAGAAISTGVRLAQLEVPVASVAAFFTAPGAEETTRILNTAPAITEATSLFEHSDIIIANQHELAHYLGLPNAPAGPEEALAARQLLTRPDQAVIVTLGAQGAVAVRSESHFHAPALKVTARDTIGAGDCFCGALAALLDAGETLEHALPLANAAAALCTQKDGAIPAMPTLTEARDFAASAQAGR